MIDDEVLGGLLVVDKPAGMTSHDVVGRARRFLRTRKVGHAGTLDPMATGVLVLGVGRATKLLGLLTLTTKSYTATVRLGQATSTDDAEGEPVGEAADTSGLSAADYLPVVASLTGQISQRPSSVSAIKVAGRRAYDLVRSGEAVELDARPVTVSRFDVLGERRDGGFLDLDVVVDCSSGTYVRALARDLGGALGVGGHLTALRRTQVGPFTLGHAVTLGQLEDDPRVALGFDQAVAVAFPRREVSEDEAVVLSHGRWLDPAGIKGVYAAVDGAGRTVALLKEDRKRASPVLVARPSNL